MSLPRLAITIGDVAGIGPEIVSKALSIGRICKICEPIIVGNLRILKKYGLDSNRFPCRFIDLPVKEIQKVKSGKISKVSGFAAYKYICKAVELIESGEADGLVTAPISKAALNLAGIRYSGHTELLASLTHSKNYAMLMVSGKLRAVMVTRHISIKDVSGQLSKKNIIDTILIAQKALKKEFGIKSPRICVCSLNPHSGESGLLGNEEKRTIEPAVKTLKSMGLRIAGPLPPDSAWVKLIRGEFDLLVTMYHDQAMIGLKCLDPRKIVNVTIGLPFIRTSPGHGTGFDIAGKDAADPVPMIEAIKLAATLCKCRVESGRIF